MSGTMCVGTFSRTQILKMSYKPRTRQLHRGGTLNVRAMVALQGPISISAARQDEAASAPEKNLMKR